MSQPQKMKLLYTMKILLEKTDENHSLSAPEIVKILNDTYDLNAERKSVYNDIDALTEFGLDIIQEKGKGGGYYIGSRDFELAELKLLVDAVQSSKFITSKKSQELISRLSQLTSVHEGKQLKGQVFIYNRIKTQNETIFYNVDSIYEAIYQNKQISFHYCEWTMEKKLKFKKNGALYQVSPWALTWDDENYYMVAYDAEAEKIKHYRVDKMKDISTTEDVRLGKSSFEGFDLAAYSKKTFGMFGGKDTEVVLSAPNSMVGILLDRFGTDIMVVPKPNGHFHAHVLVALSHQFFGWVAAIGKDMRIEGPANVKQQYVEYLKEILETYN